MAWRRSVLDDVVTELRLEKDILGALLPMPVLSRILGGELRITAQHDDATVMFIYLEDCEDLTRRFGPFRMIEWIHTVYERLDGCLPHCLSKHKVVCVKTLTLNSCVRVVQGFPSRGLHKAHPGHLKAEQ